jgi:hypothetical protein
MCLEQDMNVTSIFRTFSFIILTQCFPTMLSSKGKPQFGLEEKESGTGSTILRILSIERDIKSYSSNSSKG